MLQVSTLVSCLYVLQVSTLVSCLYVLQVSTLVSCLYVFQVGTLATEFQSNQQLYEKHAKEWTDKYATTQSQDKENQPPKTHSKEEKSDKASTTTEMSGKHTDTELLTPAKKIKLG
ncbi:hypothetical protein LSAT2_001611 [Lamellibrachia satsuma]|nr:hypothetical protein LSAT2_001611 [Lamellibrachia satsuma]